MSVSIAAPPGGTIDLDEPEGRGCELTLIVDSSRQHGDVLSSVVAMQAALVGVDSEVLVASAEPWPDAAPDGVEVVVFPSAGRGDRYDAAARRARGRLLAFVDSRVTLSPTWALTAKQLFEDEALTVASGAVVPEGAGRRGRIAAVLTTHYLRGAPAAGTTRVVGRRTASEVVSSNVIVRRSAFNAVGGFQAPAGSGSLALRLSYKVQALLGGKVVVDPGLAVTGPAFDRPGQVFRAIARHGRFRGVMARRLPEAAPLFPSALPSLLVLLLFAGLALSWEWGSGVLRAVLFSLVGLLAVSLVVHAVQSLRGVGRTSEQIFAGLALPIVLLVHGASLLRGYVAPSMEDVSPPRDQARPLRVLIMNWRDVTHPWSGGAETYMHQLARRWAADGIDVGWLTQRHAGSARFDIIDRVRVYRVGGRLTQYPAVALAYLVRLRRRYDVVVDCENGIPFFTPLYCRKPTVLVVHHVHQEIFRSQIPRQLRWLAMWLEGWLMPRVYRPARVVAVSNGTKADLVDIGFRADQIAVITNGVVPPHSVDQTSSPSPRIMCMGRLKPQKSVDVLLRALPIVSERFPSVQVDIIGQGPDRTRLERLVWSLGLASHVRFHGYVASKVRDEIAASAWVAACPSSFEGWGVVCMEASARGLPVVASNVAGLRESVRHGETGILFPYGDHEAMAEALTELLADGELRARMGAAGQRWAAQHTWDNSAVVFADLLKAEVSAAESRQPMTAPVLTP